MTLALFDDLLEDYGSAQQGTGLLSQAGHKVKVGG